MTGAEIRRGMRVMRITPHNPRFGRSGEVTDDTNARKGWCLVRFDDDGKESVCTAGTLEPEPVDIVDITSRRDGGIWL